VRVNDLDFFVDLVVTGTVLGLDHTSTLDDVEEVLGPAGRAPSGMITDSGLVEFGWWRDSPRNDWQVTYFGAQAHRLPFFDGDQVGAALVDRYGEFRPRLDVDDLRTAVRARDFDLVEVPRLGPANAGYAEYREPTTGMSVLYLDDPEAAGRQEPAGFVEKVLGTGDSRTAALRYGDQHRAFTDRVKHLRTLSDDDLAAWVDRHSPATDPERADWWNYLRSRTGTAEHLRRALNRLAAERGVDSATDAALATLSTARDHEVDAAVDRWLTAMAESFAEAERLSTRRPLTADEIRRSRVLRDRIHGVHVFAPRVTSAAVAGALRTWTDLKPALLSP
jgi:hypothetical protein